MKVLIAIAETLECIPTMSVNIIVGSDALDLLDAQLPVVVHLQQHKLQLIVKQKFHLLNIFYVDAAIIHLHYVANNCNLTTNSYCFELCNQY